jgi:hypothetical protein
LIYAFEKTGLMVSEDNQPLFSDADLAEWYAAVQEFRDKQEQGESHEEDASEWF